MVPLLYPRTARTHGRICRDRFDHELRYARTSLEVPNALIETREDNMNRLLIGLAAIAGTGLLLLRGTELRSAPQRPSASVQYLEGDAYQKSRAYSPAVTTTGGRIIWLAGQTGLQDANGKSFAGDFDGQARTALQLIDRTLKREGASLQNLVSMTVFINDPRNGDRLVNLRREFFPAGKFPASTLITVSNFAQPGMMIEIQGVAVVNQ
jgi:enamine deaminase RidA (YjgF/YER057c/UK114 family)